MKSKNHYISLLTAQKSYMWQVNKGLEKLLWGYTVKNFLSADEANGQSYRLEQSKKRLNRRKKRARKD